MEQLSHESCGEQPSQITHPSHPKHRLTLLQSPAYATKSFICNACGKIGAASCYHCDECNFDMHTTCATYKPLKVAHRLHHHQLNLEFFPPYQSRMFLCNICWNAGSNHWLYRCASCKFDAHLDCATAAGGGTGQSSIPSPQTQERSQQQQVHLQHQLSYPGSTYGLPPPQYQLQHQNSAPAALNLGYQNVPHQPYMQYPAVAPLYARQQPALLVPPVYGQQQLPSPYMRMQPQRGPAYGVHQHTIMGTIVQEVIGGAVLGLDELMVESIIGGAGDD